MVRFISPGSHPWCRPASVAWMVVTSGTSRCSARVTAVCATSQSWAWITSYAPAAAARRAARVSVWLNAMVQASRESVASGNRTGSSAARSDADAVGVLLHGRALGVPGDHGDLVPGGGQGDGERVHVPAEATDQHGRVFPGEQQHAPRPGRPAGLLGDSGVGGEGG